MIMSDKLKMYSVTFTIPFMDDTCVEAHTINEAKELARLMVKNHDYDDSMGQLLNDEVKIIYVEELDE